MSTAETIDYPDGYKVEVHYDEDSYNPMKDDEGRMGELVLFQRARRDYAWQTSDKWADLIDRVHDRTGVFDDHAVALLVRWLRVCYGVQVLLPVSLLDHSGLTVYLSSGAHWCDPGGWDSSFMGFFIADPDKIAENGTPPEKVEEYLRNEFEQFAAWVEGSVFGYVAYGPDGEQIESCWGFYGRDCMDAGGYMRAEFDDEIARHRAAVHAAHVALFKKLVSA